MTQRLSKSVSWFYESLNFKIVWIPSLVYVCVKPCIDRVSIFLSFSFVVAYVLLSEKATATHSSTLAWKIPWLEEPGRLQSMGLLRVHHFHFSLSCIGEGNGNPLQGSCLENPGTGEPGGLPSMGSTRVRHDWSDLAAAAAVLYRRSLLVIYFIYSGV